MKVLLIAPKTHKEIMEFNFLDPLAFVCVCVRARALKIWFISVNKNSSPSVRRTRQCNDASLRYARYCMMQRTSDVGDRKTTVRINNIYIRKRMPSMRWHVSPANKENSQKKNTGETREIWSWKKCYEYEFPSIRWEWMLNEILQLENILENKTNTRRNAHA